MGLDPSKGKATDQTQVGALLAPQAKHSVSAASATEVKGGRQARCGYRGFGSEAPAAGSPQAGRIWAKKSLRAQSADGWQTAHIISRKVHVVGLVFQDHTAPEAQIQLPERTLDHMGATFDLGYGYAKRVRRRAFRMRRRLYKILWYARTHARARWRWSHARTHLGKGSQGVWLASQHVCAH